MEEELKGLEKEHERKVEELRNSLQSDSSRKDVLKKKLRDLISLIKTWQNYTIVLGMSSTQIFFKIEEIKNQKRKKRGESQVLKKYSKTENPTFVNLEEEDTEDKDISFNEFVESIRKEEAAYKGIGIGKMNTESDPNKTL